MKKCCNKKCNNTFDGPGIKCPNCRRAEDVKVEWRAPKLINYERPKSI